MTEIEIDTSNLKDLIDAVSKIDEEANMIIYEQAMTVQAQDRASVMGATINLDNGYFKNFDSDRDKEKFSLDMEKLRKMVGKLPGDTVEIETEKERIKLESNGNKFTLRMNEELEHIKDIEKINTSPKTTGEVTVSEARNAVKACSVVDGTINIETENETLTMDVEDNLSSATREIDFKGGDEEAESGFDQRYLNELFNSIRKLADETDISLGNDKPIKAEIDEDNMDGTYVIAPKIEE